MTFDGIEIDMLALGNADSFLLTQWKGTAPTRVLIDGGNVSDSKKVLAFLKQQGITFIDHVVCSHPHDDHVGGLPGIVSSADIDFGQAWMHLPWQHVDTEALGSALQKSEASAKRVVRIITASFLGAQNFMKAVQARNKPIAEPFEGQMIGPLRVCGPTQAYYRDLLADFTDLEKIKMFEEEIVAHEQSVRLEDILENTALGKEILKGSDTLGGAPTEPENNSSTILGAKHGEDVLLFTADAGVPALTHAKDMYPLANLKWMQIPHHGSRRNLTSDLVSHFRPKTAFVSAEGSKKHPRKAVVNAFLAVGTKVYSSHYPESANKRFHVGTCPSRAGYSTATPLYEAET